MTEENLGDGRRRFRQNGRCLESTPTRAAQLDPYAMLPKPNLIKPGPAAEGLQDVRSMGMRRNSSPSGARVAPDDALRPVKTVERQSMLCVHRLREGIKEDRTACINRIRGLLAEFGLVFAQGPASCRVRAPNRPS